MILNGKNFIHISLKKSGLRTQIIYDINEFAIFVSDSKPCSSYNDVQMFLGMKLENKLSEYDCIAFDGGYYYYVDKFVENCDRKGNDKINHNNFMFPIRKQPNIDLTENGRLYNNTCGSFRSQIESCFGKLGNKFKRFDNNKSSSKVTDIKVYNVQLKLSLILLNIQNFCSLYNIPVQALHALWANENFNYPNPTLMILLVLSIHLIC